MVSFPIFIGIVVALWLLTLLYYYCWDHAVALWTLYRWDPSFDAAVRKYEPIEHLDNKDIL
jgi:hypothetical protein